MEIIAEYRIGIISFGAFLFIGGIFAMNQFMDNARQYDAATGSKGKSFTAKIVQKRKELHQNSSTAHDEAYILVFEYEGKQRRVNIDWDEYETVKEGDMIIIRYHPDSPDFYVTPKMTRTTTFDARILFRGMSLLGLFFIGLAVYSLFKK